MVGLAILGTQRAVSQIKMDQKTLLVYFMPVAICARFQTWNNSVANNV